MATLETHTSWTLANLAEVASPDAHDGLGFGDDVTPCEGSAGAQFLRRVESDVREAFEDERWDEDAAHEIADGAVPIYTHELWKTFVDLAAYTEDPSELGAEPDDMTKAAGIALYMIADRLARALAEEVEEDDEDDEDEDAA